MEARKDQDQSVLKMFSSEHFSLFNSMILFQLHYLTHVNLDNELMLALLEYPLLNFDHSLIWAGLQK